MITVMSMEQRLFANNPETAKSYIKNSLLSCSWNITPVSEQLINQLVKTLYQLPEVDTRVKFLPIIDSLPRLFQGMREDKKLAFFAMLCNSSVGQLTLFCERLTRLISACAFTQIQPLYYALQLPNDFDSIVQKLMAVIKGRHKDEQDLICKTIAGFTPKVIKLLFVPDKTLLGKKKGYDLFLEKLLGALVNLILGHKGGINIGELELMLLDDKFLELLEKDEFFSLSISDWKLHRNEMLKADLLVDLKPNEQPPAKSETHSIEKRQAESIPQNSEKKRAVQVGQPVTAQSVPHSAPPINNSNVSINTAVFTGGAAQLIFPRLPSIHEILSPQLKDELGQRPPGELPHIPVLYPYPAWSTSSLPGLTSSGHTNNIHSGSSANYFPGHGATQQFLFREQKGTEAFLKSLLLANKLVSPAQNINRAASPPISAGPCLPGQQADVVQAIPAHPGNKR